MYIHSYIPDGKLCYFRKIHGSGSKLTTAVKLFLRLRNADGELRYRSLIAFGKAEIPEDLRKKDRTCLHPEALRSRGGTLLSGERDRFTVIRIHLESMSGKVGGSE